MRLAEKFSIPVVCLIDTPGAAPSVGAEERGQGMAIAENIFAMAGLRTTLLALVVGEGCSGGALGVGVVDRMGMMENAYFSVISPEGCAAILWKDRDKAPEAAQALRLTAPDMVEFGIADEIVKEPLGGAHRDPETAAKSVREFLEQSLDELDEVPIEDLLDRRYERYRDMGIYES
jgi:acetyl-CoA carboxylase carboxyl transferase subunit alpha